jgi:hypothetical protein
VNVTSAFAQPRDPEADRAAVRRTVVWVGSRAGAELGWARECVSALADVWDLDDPRGSSGTRSPSDSAPSPAVAILASDLPGRWTLADAVRLSRRWPLTPLVSVATSLVDGRRRSGPPLPGVEEVPWSDVAGRLAWWLADLDAGRRGTLGLPAAARREDRLLEAAACLATRRAAGAVAQAAVAASRSVDLDGIADLVAAAGCTVGRRICGRPPLDEAADVLVWDVDALAPHDVAWLRMLTANRPALRVVVVDSFPRCDAARAAVEAGAVAVLSRPLSLEALAGTLLAAVRRPR